jgi:hypothetical protein
MKKIMKALSLLLLAAAIFTSCSLGGSETAEEKKKEDLCKALFSKNDTKVETYIFNIEDGKWTFRDWQNNVMGDGRKESVTVYFTYTDGEIDFDKSVKVIHQVKYSKIPNYVVEKLKEEKYDKYEDVFWYKETKDADKVKSIINSEYSSLSTDFEKAIYFAVRAIPKNGASDPLYLDILTNSDHNKYYWEGAQKNTYRYLQKD